MEIRQSLDSHMKDKFMIVVKDLKRLQNFRHLKNEFPYPADGKKAYALLDQSLRNETYPRNDQEPPEHLVCKLSDVIMTDPVMI